MEAFTNMPVEICLPGWIHEPWELAVVCYEHRQPSCSFYEKHKI